MDGQEKRITRGVRIFIALSCVVIGIGIIMMVFDQHASGYLEGNARRHGENVDFAGWQVIILGILMLLVVYWGTRKERRNRRTDNNP